MRTRIRSVCCVTVACGAAALVFWPEVSRAANQEPAGINLGATSFFDGFGRNEEGFTYLGYAQYAMARSIHGDNGQPDPVFKDPQIDVFALINQLVYVLPEKLFNDSAHLGIDFIVPVVAFHSSVAPPPAFSAKLTDNDIGLGDLTFGPLLQFRPILSDGRPVFSTRVEFDVIAPTGQYDPGKDINQGSNFTSLVPNWAMTVLPIPHLEVSARLNYVYNFSNIRPALGPTITPAIASQVRRSQAGQEGWVNFAASYEVLHSLHAGVNGYLLQQFNLDLYEMQDGSSNSGQAHYKDSGAVRVLGIGPGALYEFAAHDKLYANVYFEPLVYNWPRATVFNLHWLHGF